MSPEPAPLIFLSAGEASGDHYGAEIITALRRHRPASTFSGLGGPAMEQAGLHRVIRAEDVAVMGITEILRHVPRILRAYRTLVRSIRRNPPAAAVLIDFPDVNFRLARHLHRLGVPVVWFVSPQLWAWKRGRLRWVQQRVDRMLVIFPFEEPFYRNRGVAAEFVGHPLASLPPASQVEPPQSGRDTIALLPGSRWKEVAANLPQMVRAAHLLAATYNFVLPVASTLQFSRVEALLRTLTSSLSEPPSITLVRDAFSALTHARVSIVASGTATVLAAVAGNPFVVVYRVSPLTFALARRLVRYPAEIPAQPDAHGTLPIAMVNLLAGHRLVPELINQHFTAEAVVNALTPLLADGPARQAQIDGLRAVRASLLPPASTASLGTARVAEVVLELIEHRATHEVRSTPPRV